jgi:hypothetical protein
MITQFLSQIARTRVVPRKGWKVLTSKDKRNFYKGKGSMKTGVLTSWGKFVPLAQMKPKYVVPDLKDFPLKPYVANYDPEKLKEASSGAAGQRSSS